MKSHLGWNELIPIAGCVLVLGVTGAALGSAVFGRQDLQGRARADLRSWVLAVNQYAQDNNGSLPLQGYAVGYGAPRTLAGWPADGKLDADDPGRDLMGEYYYIPYDRVLRFTNLFNGLHTWDPERDPVVRAPGGKRAPQRYTFEIRIGDRIGTHQGVALKQSAWLDGRIGWEKSMLGFEAEFAANDGLKWTREAAK